ncbi:hypothetical protein STEG23_026576, partial [Scotinomys teguina]
MPFSSPFSEDFYLISSLSSYWILMSDKLMLLSFSEDDSKYLQIQYNGTTIKSSVSWEKSSSRVSAVNLDDPGAETSGNALQQSLKATAKPGRGRQDKKPQIKDLLGFKHTEKRCET